MVFLLIVFHEEGKERKRYGKYNTYYYQSLNSRFSQLKAEKWDKRYRKDGPEPNQSNTDEYLPTFLQPVNHPFGCHNGWLFVLCFCLFWYICNGFEKQGPGIDIENM